MLPFINIRYCCAAVMCSIWLTAVCAHQSVTLRSSTGDEVTIDYNVSPQEGKVIISFDYVNDYLLGNRNKLLYYRYLDKGEIRIFFFGWYEVQWADESETCKHGYPAHIVYNSWWLDVRTFASWLWPCLSLEWHVLQAWDFFQWRCWQADTDNSCLSGIYNQKSC